MASQFWRDFKPPEWVDHEAFLFLGADPAWTPKKELERTVSPVTGVCPICGGDGCYLRYDDGEIVRDGYGDPIFLNGKIELDENDHNVCGRCYRYGLDHRLDKSKSWTMNVRPEPPRDDEGEVGADGKSSGPLDLTPLVLAIAPKVEPGYVTKAVAAGSVSVPERWAHLLDEA